MGTTVLISSVQEDPFRALDLYRQRDAFEEGYAVCRLRPAPGKKGVWSEAALKGRLFVRFLSFSYGCVLSRLLAGVKNRLETEKSGSDLRTREELRDWLRTCSGHDLLALLDTMTTTTVTAGSAEIVCQTDLSGRDRLLLDLLGLKSA